MHDHHRLPLARLGSTVLGALLTALLLAAPGLARADDDAGLALGVAPAPVSGSATTREAVALELRPGQDVVDAISVSNLSAEDVVVDVYAGDAVTTLDGHVTAPARTDPVTETGAWIGLDVDEVTVPAGMRVDVPFRVTVPDDATPGDHVGVVLVAPHEVSVSEGGAEVLLDVRAGVLVEVLVVGDVVPALTLTDVSSSYAPGLGGLLPGPVTVTFTIENPGNLRQSATGWLTLDGPFGLTDLAPVEVHVPELLPGSSVTLTEVVADVPPVARGHLDLALTPQARDGWIPSDPVHERSVLWLAPWVATAVVLLVAAGVALAVRRARRRRAAARATEPVLST